MKVAFFAPPTAEQDLAARVARELTARGAEPSALIVIGPTWKRIQDASGAWGSVEDLAEHVARSWADEPDVGYLRQKEIELGLPNLLQYAIADPQIWWYKDRKDTLRALEQNIRFLEVWLDRVQPDAIVTSDKTLTCNLLWTIAGKRGIPTYFLQTARMAGRVVLARNPYERFETVEEHYARFQKEGVPTDLAAQARSYIEDFRARSVQPTYLFASLELRRQQNSLRHNLKLARQRFREYYFEGARNVYRVNHPVRQGMTRLGDIIRDRAVRLRDPFQHPVEGEKYVFFPLHYEPEAAIYVLAPFYTDQLAVAENIAKSLPIDHMLYVKEHPAMVGRRDIGAYERLHKLPNVRVISPSVHSHALIRSATAVAVITSTVGWEAALYGKPLFVFGEVFYNAFAQATKVRDIEALPGLIEGALQRFRPDEGELATFVAAMYAGSHPGEWDNPDGRPQTLTPENVTLIADAIMRTLAPERNGP